MKVLWSPLAFVIGCKMPLLSYEDCLSLKAGVLEDEVRLRLESPPYGPKFFSLRPLRRDLIFCRIYDDGSYGVFCGDVKTDSILQLVNDWTPAHQPYLVKRNGRMVVYFENGRFSFGDTIVYFEPVSKAGIETIKAMYIDDWQHFKVKFAGPPDPKQVEIRTTDLLYKYARKLASWTLQQGAVPVHGPREPLSVRDIAEYVFSGEMNRSILLMCIEKMHKNPAAFIHRIETTPDWKADLDLVDTISRTLLRMKDLYVIYEEKWREFG